MDFVFFTKTRWSEPPRIRHQVARMLVARGHEVTFFERNRWLGRPRARTEGAVRILQHGELLHHQLRVLPLLSRINGAFEVRAIRSLHPVPPDSVIVNFNYDYVFIRELAPTQAVVTILNDDFLAAARPPMRREARRVLGETVRQSDVTLAVSFSLLEQARIFTSAAALFLPWARRAYRRPAPGRARRDALYWGYISDRLDLALTLAILDAGLVVHFVGPVSGSRSVRHILSHANARYYGVAPLDDLDGVIDQCACSVLPYDVRNRGVAAATVSNRAFDLLSAGLPLLYAPLPRLLEAPPEVLTVCGDADAFVGAAADATREFDDRQRVIAAYLDAHTEERRYGEFMTHVSDARQHRC